MELVELELDVVLVEVELDVVVVDVELVDVELVDVEVDGVLVSGVEVDVVGATDVLVAGSEVDVVGGFTSVVVVVGREGGGGRGGSSMPRSGNASWEQSRGSPVRPSTNEQYKSWHAVRVVLDRTTAKHASTRRSL